MTALTYRLRDARKLAEAAPYTFGIPRAEDLAALAPGCLVQMVFENALDGGKYDAERMWVEIDTVDGGALAGVLTNEPLEVALERGDRISFSPGNVIRIFWPDRTEAHVAPLRGEHWARCMVDACVLSGEEPVEYIYREERDPELEGDDRDPDSGWRLRGRQGSASDAELDERQVSYVALGAVLNADDSWVHLIDAPIGAAFRRDFASGEYRLLRGGH